MNELGAIFLIVIAAIVVNGVVRFLLQRLNVLPADDSERSRGMRDVADRIRNRTPRR